MKGKTDGILRLIKFSGISGKEKLE